MDQGVDTNSGVRRRATIEDVAATAGVSVATVSRALRGLPHVAPSTRRRVEEVAARLAYRPDPAAARLATGRSRTLALAVPVLNSWYISQVVSGAEAVCAAEGYDLIVMGVTGEAARRALLDEGNLHRRVDGVVFVDIAIDDDEARRLDERGLAVVTVGTTTDLFPAVTIDDELVGRLATEHLIALGHRRIGLLGSQRDDPLGFSVPDRRRAGYLKALDEAGLEPDPALETIGNFSVLGGRDAMGILLDLDDRPTAVFAMSDEMAFGAFLAARERGLEIPADCSIVGVDDHEVSIVLNLTTVRQPVADHGAWAARLAIGQLTEASPGSASGPSSRRPDPRWTDGGVPYTIESPVTLVERATTAPPAAHRRETTLKP